MFKTFPQEWNGTIDYWCKEINITPVDMANMCVTGFQIKKSGARFLKHQWYHQITVLFLAGHLNSLNDGMEWLHKPIQKCCERKEAHSTTLPSIKSANTMNLTLQLDRILITTHLARWLNTSSPPTPEKKTKKKQSTPKILQQKHLL